MKRFRLLFCLGALGLLAAGCATHRSAALTPPPCCGVAAATIQSDPVAEPGWTVVLPGEKL